LHFYENLLKYPSNFPEDYIPFALFENIISQRLYTNNHAYFDKIFSVISSFFYRTRFGNVTVLL